MLLAVLWLWDKLKMRRQMNQFRNTCRMDDRLVILWAGIWLVYSRPLSGLEDKFCTFITALPSGSSTQKSTQTMLFLIERTLVGLPLQMCHRQCDWLTPQSARCANSSTCCWRRATKSFPAERVNQHDESLNGYSCYVVSIFTHHGHIADHRPISCQYPHQSAMFSHCEGQDLLY